MDNIETYCISLEKKREEWDDIISNIYDSWNDEIFTISS